MTGAELRAWQKRLGISTADAARLLGETVGSICAKQAGRRSVTTATELAASNIERKRSAAPVLREVMAIR
jgi:hypothetical protein